MINLRPLENFVKVVELGSLSRAAEAMHIAQPALSSQIAALEEELGIKLLDRSNRGVRATEAGTILCRHARALIQQMHEMRELIKECYRSPSGKVSVGVPMSLLEVFAVPLIKRLREQYPDIHPHVQAYPSPYLQELVIQGRLDMAVILKGREYRGLKSQLIASEELYFVTLAKSSGGISRKPISLPEVAKYPLILSAISYGGRMMLEETAARAGVELNVIAEINTSSALLATVEAGLGATMMAMSAIPRHSPLRCFIFRPFSPSIRHQFSLCTSDELPLTTAARLTAQAIPRLIADLATAGQWPFITLSQ